MKDFVIALGLTFFAGMATAIGSIVAFTVRRKNYRFLSVATGFSAGVMLYVSFVEIFPKGVWFLVQHYGEYWGQWINAASFFSGILLIGLIDNLIPAGENPHEIHSEAELMPLYDPSAPLPDFSAATGALPLSEGRHDHSAHHYKLMRMGLFTALAIAIHNFPEGVATFFAALENPALGLALAIAVALHNIPEGISVSVPIFYATGDRKKAFALSVLSGLAEPIGALAAYVLLVVFVGTDMSSFPSQLLGSIFGGVAGIMIYISLDELLPASRSYGKGHDSMLGLVAGMAVMAFSLLLMK